jgi:hypothetical protein
MKNMHYDLFISHASEDKDLVRPLAVRLGDFGYSVWYDEFVLRVGDSLTERIDYGLANSEAGILVLSPAFIAKGWPRRELAGLTTRQIAGATRLIPIWHNLKFDDVMHFSPPLADIKALHSSAGIESMVREIWNAIKPSSSSKSDQTIENAQEMVERGDYDLAMRTAFVALDRRLFGLIEGLRSSGMLPAGFRISPDPEAPWEAVKLLQDLGRLNVPAGANLEFLESEMGRAFQVSFIPGPRYTQAEAVDVVSQVASILRANPIQP